MLPVVSALLRLFPTAAKQSADSVGQYFCAALLACCAQVDWKLTRGKWRPKLLDYAKAHSEATVKAATIAAFEIMSSTQSAQADLKAAMGFLTELKVGLAHEQAAINLPP